MSKKIVRTDKEIANSFEQDAENVPNCLEYYVGVAGYTIAGVSHPDHLWTILDRIETELMDGDFGSECTLEQCEWLMLWVSKWKNEIEKYCVRLESE